jgi:hypothetical protein
MKLKHIAAAVALIATGAANAAIATGGNGSLVLIAYDKSAQGDFNNVAGVFDLGITVDDLIGSTGNGTAVSATALNSKDLSWNLNTNTFSIDGTASTAYGANSWTAAWNTLLANSDASDLSFVVTGFDTVGFGANLRSIVTGQAGSTATFSTSNGSAVQAIAAGKANDIFAPIVNKGTIGSTDNGAYTFTTADGAASRANGYAMAGDAFGNEWRSANSLIGETNVANTTALYSVDGAGKRTQLGASTAGQGVVSLNAATGVLSYKVSGEVVTPAIPEPSSYALVIAGLAVVGAAARRRAA